MDERKTVQELFDLSGKVALVTGGGGTGFGAQIAEALAEAGAKVIISSRDRDKAEQAANKMRSRGLDVHGQVAELRDDVSVSKMCDELLDAFGSIDILFNNAGHNCFVPFEEVQIEDWNAVLETNITGAMLTVRRLAPAMAEKGKGAIINLSSIYGVVSPDQRIYGKSGLNSPLVYGATKAALVQMTRYWATYYAPKIRVNCITPGGLFNDQPHEFLGNYNYRTPLGRMAGPNDLKGAALYLASDASAWVTGHNLVVDGGWTSW